MRLLTLTILGICSFLSCEKDCGCVKPPFSDSCLGETFDKFKQKPEAIKIDEYVKNDEQFYLLDGGESHYDGISPILNKQCDTVCHFGGWTPQPCYNEMTFKQTIWKK